MPTPKNDGTTGSTTTIVRPHDVVDQPQNVTTVLPAIPIRAVAPRETKAATKVLAGRETESTQFPMGPVCHKADSAKSV